MNQEKLNTVRMDEWAEEGYYEELFQLKLISKHALNIGKWKYETSQGIDLRRYSYNEERLLGEGISLNLETWVKLGKVIITLHKNKYFVNFGGNDPSAYQKTIKIDDVFHIETGIWSSNDSKYFFTISMCKDVGKPLWRGPYARVGIMIRFDTISDFLSRCRDNELIDANELPMTTTRHRNTRTGRIIV